MKATETNERPGAKKAIRRKGLVRKAA
jgi:hypothetical protein